MVERGLTDMLPDGELLTERETRLAAFAAPFMAMPSAMDALSGETSRFGWDSVGWMCRSRPSPKLVFEAATCSSAAV